MNYKIYYINLDKSIRRKEFMEKQLFDLGVCFTRISAVDGSNLEEKELSAINRQNILSHFTKAKSGEIGLFLSYKKAWSIIEDQKEDYAILLEDDVLLDPVLFNDLPNIFKYLNKNSILDISGRSGFLVKESVVVLKDLCLRRFSTPSLGTTGRIYTKLAAKNINQSMPYYLAPVDVMLQKIYQHKVPSYSSDKVYIKHSEHLVGGTTIQERKPFSFEKIILEFKRSIWRFSIKFYNLIQ